jgi:hypothetical protein
MRFRGLGVLVGRIALMAGAALGASCGEQPPAHDEVGGAGNAGARNEPGAGGAAGAAGSGGTLGVGCPSIVCLAGASILADVPFARSELQAGVLEVCRNDECYSGELPEAPYTLTLPDGASGPAAFISITIDDRATAPGASSLSLHWSLGASNEEPQSGERYRLTFQRAGAMNEVVLLDELMDYELKDLGCAGRCKVGFLNLRESGMTGTGGAP